MQAKCYQHFFFYVEKLYVERLDWIENLYLVRAQVINEKLK